MVFIRLNSQKEQGKLGNDFLSIKQSFTMPQTNKNFEPDINFFQNQKPNLKTVLIEAELLFASKRTSVTFYLTKKLEKKRLKLLLLQMN